jgi:hypothetical protein
MGWGIEIIFNIEYILFNIFVLNHCMALIEMHHLPQRTIPAQIIYYRILIPFIWMNAHVSFAAST